MQEFFNKAVDLCTQAGGKVILALVVFIVGRIIIGKIMKLISKGKMISKVDPTAASFFKNAVKIGLYVILVVSIIGILGVPMASVVAVIASCGVAVGLALQGALGNLAGGIMLLIFRPFAVGDYIVGAGRVDLTFNVAGSVPIKEAEAVLISVMEGNEKVLTDPAPFAAPLEPVSGGLKYVTRAWCKTSDYWDVYFALMRDIPTALGENKMAGPASSVTIRK